jgi:H+/Cl- antiporter ClcA
VRRARKVIESFMVVVVVVVVLVVVVLMVVLVASVIDWRRECRESELGEKTWYW